MFHASLLAFAGSLAVPGTRRLVDASPWSLPLSSRGALPK